jgi:hypothetical protein
MEIFRGGTWNIAAGICEQRDHGYDLRDIEIFRAGTWNGDAYTEDDLDEMVLAFDGVGYRPPVKLGHAESSGGPAYGWISRIWRRGGVLLADFADLPEKIYRAIKERRYDAVSSEIFFNINRGGRKFRRALKAVALLGAEIPAVAHLRPLHESFVGIFRTYTMRAAEGRDEAADLRERLAAAKSELEQARAKFAARVYAEHKATGRSYTAIWHELGGSR